MLYTTWRLDKNLLQASEGMQDILGDEARLEGWEKCTMQVTAYRLPVPVVTIPTGHLFFSVSLEAANCASTVCQVSIKIHL